MNNTDKMLINSQSFSGTLPFKKKLIFPTGKNPPFENPPLVKNLILGQKKIFSPHKKPTILPKYFNILTPDFFTHWQFLAMPDNN